MNWRELTQQTEYFAVNNEEVLTFSDLSPQKSRESVKLAKKNE